MMRRIELKAHGFVASGKVRILAWSDIIVHAIVIGWTGTYEVDRDPAGWRCSCPCRRPWCSHVAAVRVVVSVPRCPALPAWAERRAVDAEQDVLRHLDRLLVEREARREEHRRRVSSMARRLGREVGAGRLTVEQADRRIEALVTTLDPTVPVPLYVVPRSEGVSLAREAFRVGLAAGHAELLAEVG